MEPLPAGPGFVKKRLAASAGWRVRTRFPLSATDSGTLYATASATRPAGFAIPMYVFKSSYRPTLDGPPTSLPVESGCFVAGTEIVLAEGATETASSLTLTRALENLGALLPFALIVIAGGAYYGNNVRMRRRSQRSRGNLFTDDSPLDLPELSHDDRDDLPQLPSRSLSTTQPPFSEMRGLWPCHSDDCSPAAGTSDGSEVSTATQQLGLLRTQLASPAGDSNVRNRKCRTGWTWSCIWLFLLAAVASTLFVFRSGSTTTQVHRDDSLQTRPIDKIRVGHRVLAHDPSKGHASRTEPAVDPRNWSHLVLRAAMADGSIADIELLRPNSWLRQQEVCVGGEVALHLPECGLDGTATVVAIRKCPPIANGNGKVVTGTFRHHGAQVIDLSIEGQKSPIGVTPNHYFWSADANAYRRADELQRGERLLTADGTRPHVIGISVRAGVHAVYNLEVHSEHVYFVSPDGIVVHNTSLPWAEYESRVLKALGLSRKNLHRRIVSEEWGMTRYVDKKHGMDVYEMTTVDFNSDFESRNDYEVLRRKMVQLAVDGQLLKEGKIKSLTVVTPDNLPRHGRGAEYTRMLLELRSTYGKDAVRWIRVCP